MKLNVHGQVITGTLLSLRQYALHIQKCSLQPAFTKAFARQLLSKLELDEAASTVAPSGPTNHTPDPILLFLSESGEVWRLKVSDVSGFSVVDPTPTD